MDRGETVAGQFVLASEDGGFRMNIEGQIQVRYVANFRSNNAAGDDDDDSEAGFTIRRAKVKSRFAIADSILANDRARSSSFRSAAANN